MSADFVIILAAHGNHDGSSANRRVRALAEAMGARVGRPVMAAFNLGTPGFAEAIDSAGSDRILVIPLMTSDGYFVRTVLPGRCAAARSAPERRIFIAPPLGARPEILDGVVGGVLRTIDEFRVDRERATILVIGHGTRRSPTSGIATEALSARLARESGIGEARAAFLDAEPLIEDVAPALRARDVIVVPFLLGGGDHAERDIPARLGLRADGANARAVFRDRRRVIFEPALLDNPALGAAIEGTIREHAAPPIRLATRRSALAMWQAERVRGAIAGATPRPVSLVEFDASGDVDQRTPVDALPGRSPFTDAITSALAGGEVDLATHSLKDMSLEPDPALPVVAVLERGSVEEVLIARDGRRLTDLAPGARIGVSCARRAGQLRRLRPDLVAAAIRGPVDRRVALVLEGAFDGAILAAAGVERLGLERHVTQRFSLDEFTPAAGQGAIAIQARAGDAEMARLGASIDHAPTRRAVEAELALARALEARVAPPAVGAAASVDPGDGSIVLFARIISADGDLVLDEAVRSATPREGAREIAARLLARLARPLVAEGAA